MRVLAACSLGGAGHLLPLLPLLAAAERRGDETLVIGPPALADLVGRAGRPFRAGGEPSEEQVSPIREQLPVVAAEQASVLANRELFARLAATAMLPEMERTCRRWRPDLIVRDPCEYSSAVVAGLLGRRSAQVAVSLAEAEAGSINAAAPALEEYRKGLVDELFAAPYLTRFPTSLDPSPFPRTVRFRTPRPTRGRPLPDWWDGSSEPLIYLSFGTVLGHLSSAEDIYRTALRAVSTVEARVLLTVGRHFDASALGQLPSRVHVEAWVDQDDVFPEADLVVCHGGSGTAFGALESGLPLVVVPVFADQWQNARRIAGAGAGVAIEADPARSGGKRQIIAADDAPRLAEAIVAVLGEVGYRRQAERIAAEMAATPTVDDVLADLLEGVEPSSP